MRQKLNLCNITISFWDRIPHSKGSSIEQFRETLRIQICFRYIDGILGLAVFSIFPCRVVYCVAQNAVTPLFLKILKFPVKFKHLKSRCSANEYKFHSQLCVSCVNGIIKRNYRPTG